MKFKMNGFWWGNEGSGRGIKWMPWKKKMCSNKESGGWDLENLVNLIWQCCLYVGGWGDFLDAIIGTNSSYMWRSTMMLKMLLDRDVARELVTGRVRGCGRFHGYHVRTMIF